MLHQLCALTVLLASPAAARPDVADDVAQASAFYGAMAGLQCPLASL